MGALIHQHAPEVDRQIPPLLEPGGHVQTESVNEQDHRPFRVAGGADRDTRAVERANEPEILGRQLPGALDRHPVLVSASHDRASDESGCNGARRDAGRDRRVPPGPHPRCSRGTRSPILVTISYAWVSAWAASSHAPTVSPPCLPSRTTSSPGIGSTSPQSTIS